MIKATSKYCAVNVLSWVRARCMVILVLIIIKWFFLFVATSILIINNSFFNKNETKLRILLQLLILNSNCTTKNLMKFYSRFCRKVYIFSEGWRSSSSELSGSVSAKDLKSLIGIIFGILSAYIHSKDVFIILLSSYMCSTMLLSHVNESSEEEERQPLSRYLITAVRSIGKFWKRSVFCRSLKTLTVCNCQQSCTVFNNPNSSYTVRWKVLRSYSINGYGTMTLHCLFHS